MALDPTTPERIEDKKITIRWRRYGRTGGKWRADLPEGNGIDSGSIESPSLDTVERFAGVVAERYGYPIVREAEADA
jgi:hypothetical protein